MTSYMYETFVWNSFNNVKSFHAGYEGGDKK